MNTRVNMKASGNSVRSLTWNNIRAHRGFRIAALAACAGVFASFAVGYEPGGTLRAQSQAQKKSKPPANPGGKKKTAGMLHPMRAPVYISGSFGEYRNYGRFHYGVDYKTFNRNGLPVLMPANGVVRRVQVSEKGYGNALFIGSGSSMFTFAHLQDFMGVNPELDYLRSALEFLRPTHRANVAVPGWFRFRRGQVVARSGESGSGAPHLHFEVRRGSRYINALSFAGLEIKDRTAPVLRHLYVEFGGRVRRLPVKLAGGGASRTGPDGNREAATVIQTYAVGSSSGSLKGDAAAMIRTESNSIVVPTRAGVRLRIGTYDTMVAQNRNGVQGLAMRVDGKAYFKRELNRISTGELGRADKTYDTVRTIIGREYVYLLFDVGAKRSLIASGTKDGKAAAARKISIEVGDGAGNRSVLDFNLVFRDAPSTGGSTSAGSTSGGSSSGGRGAGKPAAADSSFTRVGPRAKPSVTAKSGTAELTLSFAGSALHLPGLVRITALKNPPREKPGTHARASATPEKPAFQAVGPAFDVQARNLYYRRFARGKAKWPAEKDAPVGLFGFHAASGRYRLVALPYKKKGGFAYYRFTYRMTGPIAQLIDRSPPRISNRFRWKPLASDGAGGIYTREYILSDRGTGVSKRRTRVMLDGNYIPFKFIRDRSTLLIEIPGSMIPKRGAMLSIRTGDFADNMSDWHFDFISPGSR